MYRLSHNGAVPPIVGRVPPERLAIAVLIHRASVVLGSVILSGCTAGRTLYSPEWDALSGALCIERIENHGCVNAHPSRVTISLVQWPGPLYEAVLTGGQAICFFVQPERYSITVSSREACYPEPTEREKCFSAPYPATVSEHEVLSLNIWPAADRESYTCGWEVLPRGVSQAGNCLQPHPPPECARKK